jgi:hypothetical protein
VNAEFKILLVFFGDFLNFLCSRILGMKLEGKAQSYRSVFTNFKFRTPVESYDHGTPYHWDNKQPVPYGFAA